MKKIIFVVCLIFCFVFCINNVLAEKLYYVMGNEKMCCIFVDTSLEGLVDEMSREGWKKLEGFSVPAVRINKMQKNKIFVSVELFDSPEAKGVISKDWQQKLASYEVRNNVVGRKKILETLKNVSIFVLN